jgi:hypothetical protein
MKDTLFERLLYEEESTTLDFKKEQYRFSKASEDEKSELLKDILGFANAWRRSEAYILIGVEDVRGGRGNVTGIAATDHLDDHSLQQFVNNLTNRAVRFHYEAFGFESKQVGIIRIEDQTRPLYLKKDFGKLKKGEVYVRRGSSTDPTKPANPDEIALMGSGLGTAAKEASLVVEFADPDREHALGAQVQWSAECCGMPNSTDIPTLEDETAQIRLPGGGAINAQSIMSTSLYNRINSDYYHEIANYIFFKKLFRKTRLVVMNVGEVPATDVRLEISLPNAQGIVILDGSEIPDAPKRRQNISVAPPFNKLKPRPAIGHPGDVDIEQNDDRTKVEIECGSLQPGRKVWTDTFFIGIERSGEFKLTGYLLAANLPQPQAFALSIDAAINQTKMTVDELLSLDEPTDEDD